MTFFFNMVTGILLLEQIECCLINLFPDFIDSIIIAEVIAAIIIFRLSWAHRD